jgi:hypothetical protein
VAEAVFLVRLAVARVVDRLEVVDQAAVAFVAVFLAAVSLAAVVVRVEDRRVAEATKGEVDNSL